MTKHMEFKKIAPISLICASFIVGCSFQKNPNKGDTKEVVKVGMTKHELEDEIVKMDSTSFPDRLAYALKKDDPTLAMKLVADVQKEKINEYGSAGQTAIEIAIKAENDDIAIQLLRKGASPYLPRRGTAFSPYDSLKDHKESKKELMDMIEITDRRLFQDGVYSANEGTEGLTAFLVTTRFPFLKNVSGKGRLIDEIIKDPVSIAHGDFVFHCGNLDFDLLIGLIEKIEGPILGIDDFAFAKLGATIGAEETLNRGLKSVAKFSIDQRKEILEGATYFNSMKWAAMVFKKVGTQGISSDDLSDMLMNGVKNRSGVQNKADIYIKENQQFLEAYPKVYSAMYDRAGIEKEAKAKSANDDEVRDTNLPGGKEVPKTPIEEQVSDAYAKLIDMDEPYKSCISND